jgi:hypothetical protein
MGEIMKIRTIAMLAALMASGAAPAFAQQVGRFQVVTAPPSPTDAADTIILLDTVTGQTWMLSQVSTTEWAPVRFWNEVNKPLVPLPPESK